MLLMLKVAMRIEGGVCVRAGLGSGSCWSLFSDECGIQASDHLPVQFWSLDACGAEREQDPLARNLEIEPQRQLNLPCRSNETGRPESWICRACDAVTEFARNLSRENGGTVNRIDCVHVGTIEEIENFGAGFGFKLLSKSECFLKANVGGV